MLDLTGDHIAQLGDEDLRLLVVMLCEAELRHAGHPVSVLTAGGNQTAKDGGIDVRVSLPESADVGLDFIPRPATGFQVKSEDMPPGAIETEMRPKGKLRDSIKELIAHKGAYVIVGSHGTVSDLFLGKRRNAMAAAVKEQPNASALHLDFYDRGRLATWARKYAGVELWVRERIGMRLRGWQPYAAWSGGELGTQYVRDDTARVEIRTPSGRKRVSVADGVDLLRDKLNQPSGIVRLIGLSGTGKTRLVQALFESGIGRNVELDQGIVRYTDLGHAPEPNARDMLHHLGTKAQRAIVVVDNCNPSTHNTLVEVARQFPSHLSLITVEYDVADDDVPEATALFELASASDNVLRHVLERRATHLTQADVHLITGVSGGNARIALALARTVQHGESLGALNDSEVFQRLFRQGQADDHQLLRAAEVCSLVYSFDGETLADGSELHVLTSLAGMPVVDFYRHIETLKGRDLLQSRNQWRALLPPALANRLAKTALKNLPRDIVVAQLGAHARLLSSFARRLEYLDDSEAARAIATSWLEDPQWIGDFATLNDEGRQLLDRVAPLAPHKVLACLELALSASNVNRFMSGQHGVLSEWSSLARHLAHDAQAFERAAAVLLILAEREDENRIDCRNAFRETFRMVLSGTLATQEQRIGFLNMTLASQSESRRELGRDAAAAMLEISHGSSSHEFTFGARSRAYGWEPQTPDEVAGWVKGALSLMRKVAQAGAPGLGAARAALATNFRDLWREHAREALSGLMVELSQNGEWPAGWVAVRTAMRFDRTQMPASVVVDLEALANKLAPQNLAQEILAYSGGHVGGLDISDALDESDAQEAANSVPPWERVYQKCIALGQAASADDEVLTKVLPTLHCASDNRSAPWGEGLGSASPDPTAHWRLLYATYSQSGRDRNAGVLRGFVAGLRKRDKLAGDEILDAAIDDHALASIFPSIFGMPQDDADGDRMLRAITKGEAPAYAFTVRTSDAGPQGLSTLKACQVLAAVSLLPNGLLAAIDELCQELFLRTSSKISSPPELLSLGRSLLERYAFDSNNSNVVSHLTELAKRCLQGPEAQATAALLASRLADAIDAHRVSGYAYGELACTLLKLQPTVALDALLLNTPGARKWSLRSRSFYRKTPVLHCAPVDAVLAWVAADPDDRAPLVAAGIRLIENVGNKASALDDDEVTGSVKLGELAGKLLDMVKDKKPVLTALNQSFYPTQYSGGLTLTLTPYLTVLEQMLASPDGDIAAWASESILTINRRVAEDSARESLDEERFE